MDRVRPRAQGGRDDRLGVEVALARPRRPDADDVIGKAGGNRIHIRFRGAENGLDAEVVARAEHAHGDLAAIGDEQAADVHSGRFTRMRISAGFDELLVERSISTISAARPALIAFISFIVSMMPTTVDAPTSPPTSTKGGAPGLGAR